MRNYPHRDRAGDGGLGGGGGAGFSPSTFSDGKITFFYFGYPDLSLTTQTRFSNRTILNAHKQRTDKLCLVAVANEFVALNDNTIGKATSAPSDNLNVRVTLNRCVCWV